MEEISKEGMGDGRVGVTVAKVMREKRGVFGGVETQFSS